MSGDLWSTMQLQLRQCLGSNQASGNRFKPSSTVPSWAGIHRVGPVEARHYFDHTVNLASKTPLKIPSFARLISRVSGIAVFFHCSRVSCTLQLDSHCSDSQVLF